MQSLYICIYEYSLYVFMNIFSILLGYSEDFLTRKQIHIKMYTNYVKTHTNTRKTYIIIYLMNILVTSGYIRISNQNVIRYE